MKREKKIGKLKKAFGLKGYATALPGHAVYDDGERFVIYLNHPTSIERLRVPFPVFRRSFQLNYETDSK
jgi:hypothetical protein